MDGETIDAGPGDYVRVPPGVVHRFSNPTGEPGRFLGVAVPSGIESYLEELGELMAGETTWPPADMTPAIELMAKYDTYPPPAPH